MGSRVEIGSGFRTTCYDIMLNYQFSQKIKLLGNDEFNHYSNTMINQAWDVMYQSFFPRALCVLRLTCWMFLFVSHLFSAFSVQDHLNWLKGLDCVWKAPTWKDCGSR